MPSSVSQYQIGNVGSGSIVLQGEHLAVGLDEEKLVASLEARGIVQAAENAGLQRRVIIALAMRLRPQEKLNFDQALTELERAVEIALDVIHRGQRGADEDDFVNATLTQVADKTKNEDLDGAAQTLEEALAEVDREEAEQRAAAQRKRIVFLDAAVAQHTLRRDAVAVATCIETLVSINQSSERSAWLPVFRQRLDAFYEDGEKKGVNFSLSVAIELARRMASTANDESERWTAAILFGNALQTLGARESGTARLEEAVTAYRAALQERTRERVPLDWATTQNNLANTLWRLGERTSGTAQLEEAAAAYRAASEIMTRERVPLDWAMTQTNLGNALSRLGERESGTAQLEEAVAAYRAALEEWTRERVPLQWATMQNNLGAALTTLGERESGTARLLEAVAAYRNALQERTRERVPLDWATTQMNLGNALVALGERTSGTARLEEAVAAYRNALQERTRERVPLDWATTQMNLGNALVALGERTSGTARLEQAVAAYRAALEEWTRERVPLDWARTHMNLGNALVALGERESGTARLEEAIAAYHTALQERTRERVPLDWAMTQMNLGNALMALGERESGTALLEQAVAAWNACLEVATSVWPTNWVRFVQIRRDQTQAKIRSTAATPAAPTFGT